MKKIIVFIIAMITIISVNAQGRIGYTETDLKYELDSLFSVHQYDSSKVENVYLCLTQVTDEEDMMFLYYLTTPTKEYPDAWVYLSVLVPLNTDGFKSVISWLDHKFVKMEGYVWITYYSGGAVTIKMKSSEESKFPVFYFTYESY